MQWRVDTEDQAKVVYNAIVNRLKREKRALTIAVTHYKKAKTYPQLEKVHGMIRDFAISQSRSMQDMKDLLKFHVGYTRIISMKNGKSREVPKSFADATRDELSTIIDQLITLAIDYDVELSQ